MGEDNFIADYLSRNISDDIPNDDDKEANDKNVSKEATDNKLSTGL